jgi:hypothetical protein
MAQADDWHIRGGDLVTLEFPAQSPDGGVRREGARVLRVYPHSLSVEPLSEPGERWRVTRAQVVALTPGPHRRKS